MKGGRGSTPGGRGGALEILFCVRKTNASKILLLDTFGKKSIKPPQTENRCSYGCTHPSFSSAKDAGFSAPPPNQHRATSATAGPALQGPLARCLLGWNGGGGRRSAGGSCTPRRRPRTSSAAAGRAGAGMGAPPLPGIRFRRAALGVGGGPNGPRLDGQPATSPSRRNTEQWCMCWH